MPVLACRDCPLEGIYLVSRAEAHTVHPHTLDRSSRSGGRYFDRHCYESWLLGCGARSKYICGRFEVSMTGDFSAIISIDKITFSS